MSTIAENLLALQQVKTDIKTAIEGKGQDLTNVPFTEYAEKINLIGGADVSETNIQGYKYQDLTRVISTGGEFATDEAYESAENYLQGLYTLIMGG